MTKSYGDRIACVRSAHRPTPLLFATMAMITLCVAGPTNAFITATSAIPSRIDKRCSSIENTRPLLFQYSYYPIRHRRYSMQQLKTQQSWSATASKQLNNLNDEQTTRTSTTDDGVVKYYTPADRPILATVDTISLILFAAIGKSSHSSDSDVGGIDDDNNIVAILYTALPFVVAWLTTSLLTGIYSPDINRQIRLANDNDDDNNNNNSLLVTTATNIGKGWAVAIPFGIGLRGTMKGYVPPVPFVMVTLIATFVILVGMRMLYTVLEDFYLEWKNFS